jgi:hypothetical protein
MGRSVWSAAVGRARRLLLVSEATKRVRLRRTVKHGGAPRCAVGEQRENAENPAKTDASIQHKRHYRTLPLAQKRASSRPVASADHDLQRDGNALAAGERHGASPDIASAYY